MTTKLIAICSDRLPPDFRIEVYKRPPSYGLLRGWVSLTNLAIWLTTRTSNLVSILSLRIAALRARDREKCLCKKKFFGTFSTKKVTNNSLDRQSTYLVKYDKANLHSCAVYMFFLLCFMITCEDKLKEMHGYSGCHVSLQQLCGLLLWGVYML